MIPSTPSSPNLGVYGGHPGQQQQSLNFARPPTRASTHLLRARAARGRAGRDFSSKLAWLDSHRIRAAFGDLKTGIFMGNLPIEPPVLTSRTRTQEQVETTFTWRSDGFSR